MLDEALEAIKPHIGVLGSISLLDSDADDIHQGLHECLFNSARICLVLLTSRLVLAIGLTLVARHTVDDGEARCWEPKAIGRRSLLHSDATWHVEFIHEHLNII